MINTPPAAPSLLQAYRRTRYRARLPRGDVTIRVGERCLELDGFLGEVGMGCWVFISACNPGSKRLEAPENRVRHDRLVREVTTRGFRFVEGSGEPDEGTWPAEASILVLGMARDEGCALGRLFGQNAIIWGERGRQAQLAWCTDDGQDQGFSGRPGA